MCRNQEREGLIRPLLVKAGEFHIAGVYRIADSSGDYRAMLQVSRPDAIFVDSSIPPREALELASVGKVELPRIVTLIGVVEKDFDFLQEAISRGIDAVLPEPLGVVEFKSRLEAALRERQRTRDFLKAAFHGRGGEEGEGSLAGPREPGTTLAFVSSKDGEGKSTVALNLGLSLAKSFGKKVVYIDLDETLSETSMLLNRKPTGTLANVLALSDVEYSMAGIRRFAIDYFGDGSFLAIAGSQTLEPPPIDRSALDLLLCFLRYQVDFVLLDCPVRLCDALRSSLELSDWHIAVVQNTLSSLRNTRIYLQELKRLEFPPAAVRVVLNRVSKSTGLAKDELEKYLNPYPIVASVVSNGPVVIESVTVGVPLVLHAPESDIAGSIGIFAKRLLGVEASDAGDHSSGRLGTMLGNLFRRRTAP